MVIVFVDDGDLRTVEVLIDVLGGTGALVGVGEADLEHVVIVVDGNDIVAGGGGGQGEHPVLIGQRDHGKGRLGGDGAHQDLHAVVHQGVVGVDGGLSVVDVVLSHQLKLDVAAQGIDFVHRDLGGIGHAGAIDGGAAGQGANDADFEGAAAELSPPAESPELESASSEPLQAARLRTITMAIMRAKNFFFILQSPFLGSDYTKKRPRQMRSRFTVSNSYAPRRDLGV